MEKETLKNRQQLIKKSNANKNDSPLIVTSGVSVWNLKPFFAAAVVHITAAVMWRKPVKIHLNIAASLAVCISGDPIKSYLFHTCVYVCVKETTNTAQWVTK